MLSEDRQRYWRADDLGSASLAGVTVAMDQGANWVAHPPLDPEQVKRDLALLSAPLAEAIFDRDFYLAQLGPEDSDAHADPVLHYAAEGYRRGLDPSPYFSTSYYLKMAPDVLDAGRNPLSHYIENGAAEGRRFHPRFSIEYYLEQRSTGAPHIDVLSDFLYLGRRSGIVPDPFFDASRAAELYPACATPVDGWMHYLRTEAGRENDPFPICPVVQRLIQQMPQYSGYAAQLVVLFDADHYLLQLGERGIEIERADALLHYVQIGHATLDPHPLFDTLNYYDAHPDVDGQLPALLHYIVEGAKEGRHPHPLFTDFIPPPRKPVRGRNPLYEYLLIPPEERPSPSGYFDAVFYRNEHAEIDWTVTDPLCHYIEIGAAKGWQPHPLFDPRYYAKSQQWRAGPGARTPLADFVSRPPDERPKPFAMFDAKFYVAAHADLHTFETGPASHFMQHGNREFRRPNRLLSDEYIYSTEYRTPFHDRTAHEEYLRQGLNYRSRVIFVSHDATRTGAPAILLALVKHFAQLGNIECITIVDQHGPLVREFEKHSHVLIPTVSRTQVWSNTAPLSALKDELKELLALLEDNPPLIAVCNSAESRLYVRLFKEFGIPVVSLVHEIAEFYQPEELQILLTASERVIYPSQYVLETMRRQCELAPGNDLVLPQGLLRDTFGTAPQVGRARVLADYPIDQGDCVIAGCGTLDGRKGFDLFVTIARRLRDRYHGKRAVKFLWIGGMKNWRRFEGAPYDCTRYWASWELERANLQDMVLVTGEVPNIEPFLLHSDIFLLTSRADPMPCVVHEAMACALPVLCFADCGGAPEAVGPAGGVVLPYQDVEATVDAIIALVSDEERRAALGSAARERVRTEYRFADYAVRIGAVMDEVLEHARPLFGKAPVPKPSRGRVYFTMPGWNLSGVNTFTETLVNYLNDSGFDAEILFTPGRHICHRFVPEELQVLPKAPHRFLQPPTAERDTWGDVLREFLEDRAPCVLIPNYDYLVSPIAAELPSSVGVVGIAHADDREHYSHCYRLGHYWNRIVAVSDVIKGQIAEQNPVFAAKTAVIRYGLRPPDETAVLAAFNSKMRDATPIELLYAGRFEAFQKRIGDYVELARRLAAAKIPFRFQLIGDGTEFERVSRLLSPLVQNGSVVLPGRLDHMAVRGAMLDAHCFILLSEFEGLPLALIEAMQAGCIPIAYNIRSGVPELVKNGENGFLVPQGALDEIVAHLHKLQQNTALRKRLGKKAMKAVHQLDLTDEAMGTQYAGLLDEVFDDIRNGRYLRPQALTI